MDLPENFYLDVRIRARAIAKGLVTTEQVEEHLRSLPDQESSVDGLGLDQPALISAEQAPEPAVAAVVPALATPLAVSAVEPPAPPPFMQPPVAAPPPAVPAPYAPPEPVSYEDRVTPIATPPDFSESERAPAPVAPIASPPAFVAPVAPPPAYVEPPAAPAPPAAAQPPAPAAPPAAAQPHAPAAPPAETSAESPSRPVSVPPARDLASDGATEVSDAEWDSPDDPGSREGSG